MQTHITQYGAPPTSMQEVWICLCSVLVRTCTSVMWAINPPSERECGQREEVLDLTLINRNAENCISDWHVSDGASHLYSSQHSVSHDFFSISQHPHRSFRDAAEYHAS